MAITRQLLALRQIVVVTRVIFSDLVCQVDDSHEREPALGYLLCGLAILIRRGLLISRWATFPEFINFVVSSSGLLVG